MGKIKATKITGSVAGWKGRKPMFGQGSQFASDIPGTPYPEGDLSLTADDISNRPQSPEAKRQSNAEHLDKHRSNEQESYEDKERKDRYNEQMGRFAPERPASAAPDRFPADPAWNDFQKWEKELD